MTRSKEIIESIKLFQKSIAIHIPALKRETNNLIKRKEKDNSVIEHLLDSLLSLNMAGVDKDLFFRLLEYYRTINPIAAEDYLRFYKEISE